MRTKCHSHVVRGFRFFERMEELSKLLGNFKALTDWLILPMVGTNVEPV